jgi:hypothetical protein
MSAVLHDFKPGRPALTMRERKTLRVVKQAKEPLDEHQAQRRILSAEFWSGIGFGCIFGFTAAIVFLALLIPWIPVGALS